MKNYDYYCWHYASSDVRFIVLDEHIELEVSKLTRHTTAESIFNEIERIERMKREEEKRDSECKRE